MSKKNIYIAFAVFLVSMLFVKTAEAICPLCAVAVGAGIGLAEYFGVDNTITGLWVGGMIVSLIMWTIHWMNSKGYRFKGRKILITFAYYVFTIAPLYYPMGIMGRPLDKLWGMDKLLLGIIFGSVFFFCGGLTYILLKKHNNDRVYFPFQKIILPIAPLIVLSAIFYFITR